MSKFLLLLLGISMFFGVSYGQNHYQLEGRIVDENQRPLVGATVFLKPINKGTSTNSKGYFSIKNIAQGKYEIEIQFIGYNPFRETITLFANKTFNAALTTAPLGLNEVLVTDNYAAKRKREATLNIEVVSDDYLKHNLAGSLMKSLERLPGVSTIDIGAGLSKPVIRGLGFNRIVVVENNIKHQAQQWGVDHGLEIDQYAVDNVEIIKGPASLMYGSDAIGGVVDMKNRKNPEIDTYGGSIDLTAKSNNNSLGSSVALYARKGCLFSKLRATLVNYSDYRVPADSVDIYSYRAPLYKNYVRNTAGKEQNFHLSFGLIKQYFQSKVFISNTSAKSGFFANAYGLEPRNVDTDLHDKSNRDINYPYQEVNHFKIINTNKYHEGDFSMEIDFGFQHNHRQEWSEYVNHGYMPAAFPENMNFASDLDRQFEKTAYSANTKLSCRIGEITKLFWGVSSEYQNNTIDGRGFIIPAYTQLSAGSYLLSIFSFSKNSILQAGVRYDIGSIRTKAYTDWFSSPINETDNSTWNDLQRAKKLDLNFSNFSWSLGYTHTSDHWSLRGNVGKSFRMPIPKELAANGVNYHRFSYEVGDPDLSPEVSYQFDTGVEFSSTQFTVGVTPFVNYFTNYIYLNPTSKHDRLYGNGNQIFYYTQSQVLRYGGEIHAHYEFSESLQLGVMGEFVYSKQLSGNKKGFSLPFSPPASALFNIKYKKKKLSVLKNAYISLDYRLTTKQNNIVPPEVTTPGYQLLNLRVGGGVLVHKQTVNISMQVTNLLNTKYYNHTSYYRLINIPGQGRNFILNVSIPLSGQFKIKQ